MAYILVSFFLFFQDILPLILSGYDYDTRAIIIFAPDNRSGLYTQTISLLTRDPLGLDSRDIKIFEIFNEGGIGPAGESYTREDVTSIRTYYKIEPSDFNILLSHKKFEEIFKSDKPLEIQEIFQKFDEDD